MELSLNELLKFVNLLRKMSVALLCVISKRSLLCKISCERYCFLRSLHLWTSIWWSACVILLRSFIDFSKLIWLHPVSKCSVLFSASLFHTSLANWDIWITIWCPVLDVCSTRNEQVSTNFKTLAGSVLARVIHQVWKERKLDLVLFLDFLEVLEVDLEIAAAITCTRGVNLTFNLAISFNLSWFFF